MAEGAKIDGAEERRQARPRGGWLVQLVVLTALGVLAGCGGEPGSSFGAFAAEEPVALAPRQTRELLFVAERRGEPLVTAIAYRTVDRDSLRAREIRGWLARGKRWETFLDDRWSGAAIGSPWTLVPHGDLRLAAGGEAGVEALWFERSGRNLRLRVGDVIGQVDRASTSRIHLFEGSLAVGGDPASGVIVELLRLRRPAEEEQEVSLQLVLVSADSLVLVADRAAVRGGRSGRDLLWLRDGSGIREWTAVEVSPRGAHSLPDARRDIPQGWTLEAPEVGLRGELRALGFAVEVGAERGGRREVEVRYTVGGWIERDGVRTRVSGLARLIAN